ncbi:MAG: GtrA family protein [Clostridiales bacterium]|nr:GtrA family protein [Clostridiales bacterium]
MVDFLLFIIFYQVIGIYYTISQVIGYSGGVINSFTWNKLWTFESKKSKGQTVLEFLRFMVINGISLSASVLLIKWLVEEGSWNVLIAKVLVTLVAQLINYTGYKLWVFKK